MQRHKLNVKANFETSFSQTLNRSFHFIGSRVDETRRFQAMGQLDSTLCTAPHLEVPAQEVAQHAALGVGLALFTMLFCSQNTVQLMTAGIPSNVTNLTLGSECNPYLGVAAPAVAEDAVERGEVLQGPGAAGEDAEQPRAQRRAPRRQPGSSLRHSRGMSERLHGPYRLPSIQPCCVLTAN
jgi:hypothetical protein